MACDQQRDRIAKGAEKLGFCISSELRAIMVGGPDQLKDLQERVKKAFRLEAPKLHPDTGGDPDSMIEVLAFRDFVRGLKIKPRIQRPTVTITFGTARTGSFWFDAGSTITGSTTTWSTVW